MRSRVNLLAWLLIGENRERTVRDQKLCQIKVWAISSHMHKLKFFLVIIIQYAFCQFFSDQHEKSLYKVLHQNNSELDITVAIAEHLLGKLAPGKSYKIDDKSKGKHGCKCGLEHCKKESKFGITGIGTCMFYLMSSGKNYIIVFHLENTLKWHLFLMSILSNVSVIGSSPQPSCEFPTP